jgi:hypothetical protein
MSMVRHKIGICDVGHAQSRDLNHNSYLTMNHGILQTAALKRDTAWSIVRPHVRANSNNSDNVNIEVNLLIVSKTPETQIVSFFIEWIMSVFRLGKVKMHEECIKLLNDYFTK